MQNSKERQKAAQEQDAKLARAGSELQQVLKSNGWKDVLEPILSKMIKDVIGYQKPSGEWVNGAFGDKRLGDAKATNLLWYRQALIDFNNHIHGVIRQGKAAEERLKNPVETKFKNPMLNSKYAVDKENLDDSPYSGGTINGN